MSNDRYELIDFGDGRKLESLAGHWIDRPSPAADRRRRDDPAAWDRADSRFDPHRKSWTHRRPWPLDLDLDCGGFRMPVSPAPSGHIGVFPEQAENWRWLAQSHLAEGDAATALNLFAYTGASTMALVSAGYQVAHVDAAKPNVQSAREAALHNGWSTAPIRFLVDDAEKFSAREFRRGRRYQTIILDPPAYGHSPKGKAWRIQRDLWPLLDNCTRLVDPSSFRLLVTGHSPAVEETDVMDYLREIGFLEAAKATEGLLVETGRSQLKDVSGRSLDAGFFVRIASPVS